MSSNPKESTFEKILPRFDNWAFQVFLCSTLFIVVFSIAAIHNWPPLFKHASILLACILPTGMVILSRAPGWWIAKHPPKEVLWVLLVSILGLISSLLSENPWGTLKSTVLFMVSGPFIFITTKHLFESRENQDRFLRAIVPAMLTIGLYGVYEYHNAWQILLFSDNPLPAGASLLLLSSSPLVLLNREVSFPLKLASALSAVLGVILIILLAKKGPILAIIFTFIFLALIINRKYLKLLLAFFLLAGLILGISNSARTDFMKSIGLRILANDETNTGSSSKGELSPPTSSAQKIRFKPYLSSSIRIRLESYFFALHIFKNNPVWGTGFKANLVPYLEDYKQKFVYKLGTMRYQQHLSSEYTFENIALTFLIELGSLFTVIYFGGVIYIILMCFKKLLSLSKKDASGMLIMSIIFGFAFLSLTFDTLRFPNLNWIFHSLLGLMVNLTETLSSD